MKKLLIIVFAISLGIIAGCGTSSNEGAKEPVVEDEKTTIEQVATTEQGTDQESEQVNTATAMHNHDGAIPTEPGEGEMCSMCNMKVYHKDEDMGKFTGQVLTADGKHLFADDLGCLINQVRISEEQPQGAWVRDYNTSEWVPLDEAIAVRASIETPMKMGFALFGTEEAANKYVTENPMLSPVITSYEDVDQIALDRRNAKLAKQKAAEEKMQQQGNMQGDGNMNMNGQMNH